MNSFDVFVIKGFTVKKIKENILDKACHNQLRNPFLIGFKISLFFSSSLSKQMRDVLDLKPEIQIYS